MKVKEITKMAGSTMFRLINATLPGYMTAPKVLYEADKNAVRLAGYEDFEVVHIEALGKNKMALYVK